MKLSISNIAWDIKDNETVYAYLNKKIFSGLEIAPTKLFPENPYSHIAEAAEYFSQLKQNYGLEVSSMQSIWFGKTGNIFNSEEERKDLQDYTFKAIDFAAAIGCGNLVFGNPKARNKGENHSDNLVFDFFNSIADYAHKNGTCVSLEPNPVIYGTNFINNTKQAFEFCNELNNPNLKVNVDFGTIIYNDEPFDWIQKNTDKVNHIHISEPYLKKIEKRDLHKKLKTIEFNKYISIEMGLQNSLNDVFEVIDYIAEVLG